MPADDSADPLTTLPPRQQRFVREYLVSLHGTNAAIAAGYAPKNAAITASKLLRISKVQAALAFTRKERDVLSGITAATVLERIECAANLPIGELFDEQGQLKAIHTLPIHVQRCIVSVEVVKRNLTAGDKLTDTLYKVKLIDKGRLHEILAKSVGLYSDGGVFVKDDVPAFSLPTADAGGPSIH